MTLLEHQTFDAERALYASDGLLLRDCVFDGAADGESALKESRNVVVEHCLWKLRYPFWHNQNLIIRDTELTSLCRAALWYSDHVEVTDSRLHGIKALRECAQVTLRGCDIDSPEFGWSVRGLTMRDCSAQSEYFMLRSEQLQFSGLSFRGKYAFQYITDAVLEHCTLDTKDAFWHAKNVTVRDSVVKGEYLGWYSENLTFEHCRILGTQPLCYCKQLRLIDCEMLDADLCFEKSDVEATLTAPVISIKNPHAGHICVPQVGQLIYDDESAKGKVLIGSPCCA